MTCGVNEQNSGRDLKTCISCAQHGSYLVPTAPPAHHPSCCCQILYLQLARLCCPGILPRLSLQVSQSKLVGLCRTIQAPRSFKCLTRYVLGDDRCPKSGDLVDEATIGAVFRTAGDMLRNPRSFHEGLEPWSDEETGERLFKWNPPPNV